MLCKILASLDEQSLATYYLHFSVLVPDYTLNQCYYFRCGI